MDPPIAHRNANHYHFGRSWNNDQISGSYIIRSGTAVSMEAGNLKNGAHTLAALRRGQKGIIEAIDTADPQVQRLMTLGLVEGAEVEFAGAAIGGDPLEFRLFGRGISLRQEQAQCFRVVPVGAGD